MIRGRRIGLAHILAMRKRERRAWRLRQEEMKIRNSFTHQALTFMGMAPHLYRFVRFATPLYTFLRLVFLVH